MPLQPMQKEKEQKKKPPLTYPTRCYVCGVRLIVVDDYGDYAKMVKRDGKLVRKSEQQWFDPDWVIQYHVKFKHR